MSFFRTNQGFMVSIALTTGLSLCACKNEVEPEPGTPPVECEEGDLGEWRQLRQPDEVIDIAGSGAGVVFSDGEHFTLWAGYHIATLNDDLQTWEASKVEGYPHGDGFLHARGGDTLLTQGGNDELTREWTTAVSLLDLNALSWSTHEMPMDRQEWDPAEIFWTGEAYLLWGGYRWDASTSKAFAHTDGLLLDPTTGSWSEFPGATEPVEYDVEALAESVSGLMDAVLTPQGLFTWGSLPEDPEPVGRLYDFATGAWSVISNEDGPSVRKYFHLVAGDDEVYLMGGVERGSAPSANPKYIRELWRYSFFDNAWEQIDLPVTVHPRYGHFSGGKLYVFGSCASGAVYDPAAGEFKLLSPLYEPGEPFLVKGGIVSALSTEHAGSYKAYVHVFEIPE